MTPNVDIRKIPSFEGVEKSKTVVVNLPAEMYYNLDKFQAVQKDILGRLGCQACCSGHDIRYDIQRNFAVDAKEGLVQF